MLASPFDFSVALLHDRMHDKQGKIVTTSLTLIDVHDIARSSRTYGAQSIFIAHPSAQIRKLARMLKSHWEDGFGATYNPTRREALESMEIACDLDEVIQKIDLRTGMLPKIVATSARDGGGRRISFPEMRKLILQNTAPYLMLLGTGWGMSDEILSRADYFLEPVKGPTPYNHLSVRSACAIMLDRLLAPDRA